MEPREPRIYSAEEARELREHPVLAVCANCGEAWTDPPVAALDRRVCARCPSTAVRLVRHHAVSDLAASVAHHAKCADEARADVERLRAELEAMRPKRRAAALEVLEGLLVEEVVVVAAEAPGQ